MSSLASSNPFTLLEEAIEPVMAGSITAVRGSRSSCWPSSAVARWEGAFALPCVRRRQLTRARAMSALVARHRGQESCPRGVRPCPRARELRDVRRWTCLRPERFAAGSVSPPVGRRGPRRLPAVIAWLHRRACVQPISGGAYTDAMTSTSHPRTRYWVPLRLLLLDWRLFAGFLTGIGWTGR